MRHSAFILAILLLAAMLCSCSAVDTQNQVSFYYCVAEQDYSSTAGAIKAEVQSAKVDPADYDTLLSQYMNGPKSSHLVSPYPDGCTIAEFSLDQSTAHIIMDKSFASLSGVELTLACACLSLTVQNITGYANVEIRAEDCLLDNKESITVDANKILLTDSPS